MTHSRNYKTLRRFIVPALAGGALAALAFAPTFGAEPVQSNVPPQNISAPKADASNANMPKNDVPRPDDVKTGEINEPTPHKEADPSTFTGTSVISENKTLEHQRFDNTTSDKMLSSEKTKPLSPSIAAYLINRATPQMMITVTSADKTQ